MKSRDYRFQGKIIVVLTLVHFTGDFYNSFLTPLLPVFTDRFSLTLTEVGILSGLGRFLAFVVQPSVGYFADRYRTRFFILGGTLLSVICIPLTGIVSSFAVLLGCVALGSIGSAMFHPSVAGMVPLYSGSRPGFSMSFFNTGGTFAFAAGPVLITWFVGKYGLSATPLTMIPGILLFFLIAAAVPLPEGEGLAKNGFLGTLRESFGEVWRAVLLLWVIMVLRAFVAHCYRTFLPLLLDREGFSLLSIGTVVSIFTLAGTISGLIAGALSDRMGFRKIFYTAHGLASPVLLLFLFTPGSGVYLMAFLSGFLIMATLPLGVTLAQELAPKGRSMVSSLMMGFAFGLGGMMTPIAGALADRFTIRGVLSIVALLPLLTTALIPFLTERERTRGGGASG
jgi:FSR family fosmidomycin resistance protein-like MFS transporter